ncbi:HutD family protein [Lutibacter sp. B2]|nr:HutD family protein [Lutibacter sp. B2]
MSYEIEIIRKDELQTNNWSGGTTTQLAIYPKDSQYSERNFKWRLSSAKVEVEESTFTSLPDINRIIMIIDGALHLEHEGHHKSLLKPFEQDSFSGNWTTKSFGKVTDFNLMTSKGCEGNLEAIHIEKDKYSKILLENKDSSASTHALYCINGCVKIHSSTGELLNLSNGDLLVLQMNDNFKKMNLEIHNEKDMRVNLIKSSMKY